MEKLYTVSKNKTRSWLWLRSWTHIAKFRLKLKKVGKTTRSFRYDLNQIPYNYTVEVRNRFKGLDLIECLMNYGWRFVTLYRRQVCTCRQTIYEKKKCKKAKWLPEEAWQIAEKRREAKGKGEKERYIHLIAGFQRIARRNKKAFLSDQCKEIEENNRIGKISGQIRDTKGTFPAKMGSIKYRSGMDLTEAEDIKRGGTDTQKNYTKKIFMTQIIMMVWSLT